MKLGERIKSTLLNTKKSARRFPITIAVSIVLAILLIYLREVSPDISIDLREKLGRIAMVIGLGIPLSASIGLLSERFLKDKKSISLIGYVAGAAFLVLYYNFLLEEYSIVSGTRYLGTMLIFILVFFYALKLKHDINYESYVISVFSSGFITALYSAVLYLGLSAIIFTIDNLFEANIDGLIYFNMFIIVVFIFGISLFLSKIPERDEDFIGYDYSKTLKILLTFIVIPLITAYTIILYAYFVKILITWEWPKGLVSHLVLWYSVLSVGVIFLITPVLEENKVAKLFKIWFPKLVLPILVMMFMSIWQRIDQYGVTENRYYVVLLGLWVLGIMLYFSFKKPLKNILIPISLSLVILIAIYGPVSGYSIAKSSQNNRLVSLLEDNGMLSNGAITSNPSVDKEIQREVSNVINYFVVNHSLEDIKVLPADFEVRDTKDLLGFEFTPYENYYGNENYFSYYNSAAQQPINIEGYDYYMNVSSWNAQEIKIDDISVKYNRDSHILTINKSETNLLTQDINTFAEEIHSNLKDKPNNTKEINNSKEMTYDMENESIRVKFLFTNVNGKMNDNNEVSKLESVEFLLLIDKK